MKRIADVIDKAARGELDVAAFLSLPGYTEDDKVMVYAACYAAGRYLEEWQKGAREAGRRAGRGGGVIRWQWRNL